MLSFDSKSVMHNRDWLFQMPLLIAVSLAAGLLGAAFNLLRRGLWRIRASRTKPGLRILEVSDMVLWLLGPILACWALIARPEPQSCAWDSGG